MRDTSERMRVTWRGFVVVAGLWALVGCHAAPVTPGRDGGAPEVEEADAGTPVDAGIEAPDAGADAGLVDAGPVDAGTDAGATDDAGEPDAGLPDAGPADAGRDAGPPPPLIPFPEPMGPITRVLQVALPSTTAPLGAMAQTTLRVHPSQRHVAIVCPAATAVTLALDAVDPTLAGASAGDAGVLVAPTVATVRVEPETAVDVQLRHVSGAIVAVRVHCLPRDFPQFRFTRASAAVPGYFLFGNIPATGEGRFVILLDGWGTPAWYQRVPVTLAQVDLAGPGRLVMLPLNTTPFGMVSGAAGDVLDLTTGRVTPLSTVGTPLDFHEATPLPNGHFLLLSYPVVTNVSLPGMPNRPLAECVIQEVDTQGTLWWSWRFSQHLDVAQETTTSITAMINGQPVTDAIHCNSVDALPNGDVLLSARHADAVYRIERPTGDVLWKLGGTSTTQAQRFLSLDDPEGGGFFRQHDARLLPNGQLRLFDNHLPMTGPARALFIDLDVPSNRASVAWSLDGPGSTAMGSARTSFDDGTLVGWGWVVGHAFTDFDQAGTERSLLEYTGGSMNYRTVYVAPSAVDLEALWPGLLR